MKDRVVDKEQVEKLKREVLNNPNIPLIIKELIKKLYND